MDVSELIKQRLKDLGLEQKDLAAAAEVTESYISQLLARKKAPPAPGRTDIYEKIGKVLQLPSGEITKLADLQRKEELRKKIADPPGPLFKECRELVLRKCNPAKQDEMCRIFEKDPYGELERLVTQQLLAVTQKVAGEQTQNEDWLRVMTQLSGGGYEGTRAAVLEFLSADILNVSGGKLISILDTLIDSWDMDLKTFSLSIFLNRSFASQNVKRYEFAEPPQPSALEPGLEQFLNDASLSGDATEMEIEFLKALRFKGKQPSPIYYYRELQNLRDPLHFTVVGE